MELADAMENMPSSPIDYRLSAPSGSGSGAQLSMRQRMVLADLVQHQIDQRAKSVLAFFLIKTDV